MPAPRTLRRPTPQELGERAAAAGTALQDGWFRRTSPIPYLAPAVLDGVHRHAVTLPPRRPWMMAGTQTVEGLLFLASLARALDARELFEIGTYNGLTTWCLAENLPGASVHTLDLPPEETPSLELERGDHSNRRGFAQRLYQATPPQARVVEHFGDSATFDFTPWRGRCDLVYVDGAHSEPYVRSDTANALEMLSDRGAVVWDDYWHNVEGVRRVLDSRRDLDLHRVPGTRLVVHLRAAALARVSGAAAAERA